MIPFTTYANANLMNLEPIFICNVFSTELIFKLLTQQVFLTRGYINVLMWSWLAFVNVKEHFFIFRSKVPNNYI